MRFNTLSRTAALGTLALSVALTGLVPAATAARDSTGQAGAAAAAAATPRALRLAVRAVGGAEALRGLRTFRYASSGQRWIYDEGVRPGDPAKPTDSFEANVRYALLSPRSVARFRVDSVRTSNGVARPVHEVVAGRRGFIRGVDANFSSPAVKSMPSDRLAAVGEELSLINPHVLLLRALRNPETARSGGRRTLDGNTYRVLVLKHRVAPVRLYVNTATGRIDRLRTMQHDYLRRDVQIEVLYRNWAFSGSGVRFPRTVELWSDGQRLHREVRPDSSVVANPSIRRKAFAFPAGLRPAPFQARLANIGQRTSEWIMSFAHLGFIKDGGQTAINPQQVAPGVILLGGVANNSLVIRRDSGVVVVEGPLHNYRAGAVIKFVNQRFPGARITHVVSTHHHSDHAGGMRPYVAIGARAVMHRAAVPFFRRVFADRSSTILPDRLDRTTRAARITGVPAGGELLLRDQDQQLEVYPLVTPHAVDMTVTFAQEGGVIFVSDVYTPGNPPGDGGQALNDLIVANSLNVEWIAGGHGGVISYADFLVDLAG